MGKNFYKLEKMLNFCTQLSQIGQNGKFCENKSHFAIMVLFAGTKIHKFHILEHFWRGGGFCEFHISGNLVGINFCGFHNPINFVE